MMSCPYSEPGTPCSPNMGPEDAIILLCGQNISKPDILSENRMNSCKNHGFLLHYFDTTSVALRVSELRSNLTVAKTSVQTKFENSKGYLHMHHRRQN